MGPTIVLDKNALQSLSGNELKALTSTFSLNAPPILIQEILGDLKKNKELMDTPQREVMTLAQKVRSCLGNVSINVHYRNLCEGELLGYTVPLKRGPVIGGGTPVRRADGTVEGIAYGENPDMGRLRRWASGSFSASDEQQAEFWRAQSSKLDIDAGLKKIRRAIKGFPKPHDLTEIAKGMNHFLARGQQFHLLNLAIELLGFSRTIREQAVARWQAQRHRSFQTFAPYTFFVYRTLQIHFAAVVYGIVGLKPTDRLDLEYLLYSPFCRVFCSGDNFLIAMAPAVLEADQFFFTRNSLKSDMKAIAEIRNATTEDARNAIIAAIKQQPEHPFSHPFWAHVQPPWTREDKDLELNEEGKKQLHVELKRVVEAIANAEKDRPSCTTGKSSPRPDGPTATTST